MIVTIDAYWLTFLVSTVLPIAVALVTQRLASGAVKSMVLLVLALVTGWATSLFATGGSFEVKSTVVAFFISFITAVGVHFGLLAPSGVTGKNGAIAVNVPAGIGAPVKDESVR